MPKQDPATVWLHKVLHYDRNEQSYTGHPPMNTDALLDFDPDEPRDPHGKWTSEGDEPELPLTGGHIDHAAKKFLDTAKAKEVISKAVKDWVPEQAVHVGHHMIEHEVEVALQGAILAGLTALGAPSLPAVVAAGIAGYAIVKLSNKLGATPENIHSLMKSAVRGLRHMDLSPTPGAIGDADEDTVRRALRLFDETLNSHTTDGLVKASHNYKAQ